MSLHEPFDTPDGFRLVHGAFEDCRRDVATPRHWRGLSIKDALLLFAWVQRQGASLTAFYTDVTCGVVVEPDGSTMPGWLAEMGAKVSALRIDAVAVLNRKWWILEAKPDAGYVALGQVLTYGYYGPLRSAVLAGARLGIVTDRLQPVVKPVFERFDVRVFEVGGVIAES